jgi:hypothetical protein
VLVVKKCSKASEWRDHQTASIIQSGRKQHERDRPLSSVRSERRSQPVKQDAEMVSTDEGMQIDFSAEQL